MADDFTTRDVPGRESGTALIRWGSGFSAWVDALLDRVGLRGQDARDTALAVVVAVLSAGYLWLLLLPLEYLFSSRLPLGTELALTAAIIAQSLGLCVRRRYPIGCLMTATLLLVLMLALFPPEIGVQGPALMIAAYTCGTRLDTLRLATVIGAAVLLNGLVGGLVMGALAPTVSLPLPEESGALSWLGTIITGVPLFVVPALLGAYVRARRHYADLVRERAA